MSDKTHTRTLSAIAQEIQADWGAKVNFAAKPYLAAMMELNTPYDTYGYECGKSLALYFLANASTYRGEKAKALKKELKTLCGIK
jgi:hypothetical protein